MNEFLIISIVALWVVVAINLLLTLTIVRHLAMQKPRSLRRGQRAPDFSATALDGQTHTLADYAGRALALLFVSPQCEPCRAHLPRYQALQPAAQRHGVELVLVSLGDAEGSRALAEEFKLSMPLLVAPIPGNGMMQDYQVPGTPFYVLIDARGRVQAADHPIFGAGPWQELVTTWEAAPAIGGLLPAK